MRSLDVKLNILDSIAEQLSVADITCLLQRCRKERSLDYGKRLYMHILKNGLGIHRYLRNHIVPMFVQCGSVSAAQQAFNMLPHPNEHSWTSLISSYIEYGQFQHSFTLYQKMKYENVAPSGHTITALLKACSKLNDIERGRFLHLEIKGTEVERDIFVGATLVHMYAKGGSSIEARDVFDKLPIRNVVLYNSLLAGYAENGYGHEALICFEEMKQEGIAPSAVTFVCTLKACQIIADIDRGRDLHKEIVRRGFETDPFVGNTLVDMYAKCSSLPEAQEVFDNMPVKDVVSWNVLISGYAENGLGLEALKCYRDMQLSGIAPNDVTFSSSLKACSNVFSLEMGREIHLKIAQEGLEGDISTANSLIHMYVNCGSLAEAQEVFNKLSIPNLVSWNTLITGYIDSGLFWKALKCYEELELKAITGDAITVVYILKACGSLGILNKGREIHAKAAQSSIKSNVHVASALLDMYINCGSLTEAVEAFDKLPDRNFVCWNILIAGYAEKGLHSEALKILEQMQMDGLHWNASTFVCILKSCENRRDIDKGREVHTIISQHGFGADPSVGDGLVGMYASCGAFAEAEEAFDKLAVRDVASWTRLIGGYADYGFAQKALDCFKTMQLEGIFPDAVVLVCVFKACGSIGALEIGQKAHIEIAQRGLEMDLFVANALIDMYCRCRSLGEAKELFDRMPLRDVVSWTTLMMGYSENGFGLEALKCFEQMQLESMPPNSTTFLCMFKACGIVGCLNKGREIHSILLHTRFGNDPFVGNALVGMYAKCGSPAEAQKVFDNLFLQDAISWSSLMLGYTDYGSHQQVLKLFEQMKWSGEVPDAVIFVRSLKACIGVGAIEKARQIHTEIRKRGYERDPCVGNYLVETYARCGSFAEAEKMFDKLAVRDVVSWTTIIAGHVEHGYGQAALRSYDEMQFEGVPPNVVTFLWALKACGDIGALDKGREIHNEIIQAGFHRESFVGATLIDMYAKCGSVSEARQVFNSLPLRDSVLWNAMLRGYGMNHEGKMAMELFQVMQKEGVAPDSITFTCLLMACSRSSLVAQGQMYFKLMRDEYGIDPTVDHYTCMVDLFARTGHFHKAEQLLRLAPSKEAWTALLSSCRTYGEAELGQICFQELVQLDPENANSYVMVGNIYASAGMQDEISFEGTEKHANETITPVINGREIQEQQVMIEQ